MKKEKSCGAVIFFDSEKERQYLLLHYSKGHWDFPKGHVEKDESEQETTLREVKEETSLEEVEFIPGFREQINYFFKQKGELINKDVYFFLLKSKSQDVKISFEHIGFKWFSITEALNQLTFENAKQILRKAHNQLENLDKK